MWELLAFERGDAHKQGAHKTTHMGCCCSGEANAVETELPPPEWCRPMSAHLSKKGIFSADYNVHQGNSSEGEKWMLLDAVGSIWDDGYNYFLKHRAPGQVDENGKPTSSTLGAVNIKGESGTRSRSR